VIIRPTSTLAVILLLCLFGVGTALVSQHVFDLQPCPWCILQRIIFLAIAAACLVGLAWRRRAGWVVSGALVVVLAVCGMAAALWQHFVAASATSCNLTLADRIIGATTLDSVWPDVFSPRASCAEAAVKLAGVPYDMWSLALFILLALLATTVLRRRVRS
jgi:disulfide bond formation protein DsbB